MTVVELVEHYGYIAVLGGSLIQSETVLLSAGVAAHHDLLDVRVIVAIAFAGAFTSAQAMFYLGQHRGLALLARSPRLAVKVGRFQQLLRRHHAALVLVNRFIFGFKLMGPMAMGMSGIPWRRYALFDLLGALIWAVGVAGAGKLFGAGLELMLADLHGYQKIALGLIVGLAVLAWIGLRASRALRRRQK